MTVDQPTSIYPWVAAEVQHGDYQATDALFLTFNVDLGFLEARLLGRLRATGARITVIADAGVWQPDTRAVRHAGRSYHLGLVDTPAAFHPKLMVLAGPRRAIAAVGSGNLTLGGWQYNRELLTVFTGDQEQMPVAFGGIVTALRSLRDQSALDEVADRAVVRVVETLDALMRGAEPVDTGHRVHASWASPLIESLPTEPVQDLLLSAAFHDLGSEAVRRVLARLRPRRVLVAIQPGWTVIDPVALDRVLSGYRESTGAETTVVLDPESPGLDVPRRYRHGKLIEWVTGSGDRWALTGSPNLSIKALCRTAREGGNYELAVVGPAADSLFPMGEPLDLSDVPPPDSESPADTAGSTPPVGVLSAVRTDENLRVQLNRSPSMDVDIEVSSLAASPDEWSALGAIPAGEAFVNLPAPVPAGSRIRAAWTDPQTNSRTVSVPIYVTDIERVLRRAIPERQSSRTHRASAADLFGDDISLLEVLRSDLASFALDVSQSRRPTLTHDGTTEHMTGEGERKPDGPEPWLWLQDDTVRKYGNNLAAWLLALPSLSATESMAVPWLDKISNDAEPGLDTDEDTEEPDQETLNAGEAEATTEDTIDHTLDPESRRLARQRWTRRATDIASDLSISSQLLVLRVGLAFWTAGNWSEDDPEPFTLTRDMVRSIAAADDLPAEVQQRAASLVAVALTVMRQRTNVLVGTEQTLRFDESRKSARPILAAATDEVIDLYVTGLRTAHGGTLTTSHVTETLRGLLDDDPLAELAVAMEEAGHEVHRPGPNAIHIHAYGAANPQLTALQAIAIAQDLDNIVAWATNERGDWACLVWHERNLVSVFNWKHHERWRHQVLPKPMSPAGAARALRSARGSGEGTSNLPGIVATVPKHRPTTEAEEILAALGVEDVQTPPCCVDAG